MGLGQAARDVSRRSEAPMKPAIDLCSYVRGFAGAPLAAWRHRMPWELVAQAPQVVRELLAGLPVADFTIDAEVAVHRSATVEAGALLKGPLIVGPGCFVAAGAYLRGGNWLDAGCTIGPGAELKSSFLFAGSKLAHFNFVGDSVLGADVNLEAGSIVCNHRNERVDREIHVVLGGTRLATSQHKFGALIGDACRIGANAVLAPGVLLPPAAVVGRGCVLDQDNVLPEPR
jgi:UDP-N-acetylglucosamine diphosphorylase / glucose-1-phosphate thymidylyltransferase / UDP-N-acetylgalactosamine diphosphorylase / glucosamine-1-phosphate N-acetyltransferase / galactosamine-1-phosphate N-acetyltransferase